MPINNTTSDLGADDMIQVYTLGSQGQLQPRYIKLSSLSASIDALPLGSSDTKVYRALVSQTGTNAPTSIVLENTLGITPVWSYDGVSQYSLTAAGTFTADKTFIITGLGENNSGGGPTLVDRDISTQPDAINFQFLDKDGAQSNNILYRVSLEIRVYA